MVSRREIEESINRLFPKESGQILANKLDAILTLIAPHNTDAMTSRYLSWVTIDKESKLNVKDL